MTSRGGVHRRQLLVIHHQFQRRHVSRGLVADAHVPTNETGARLQIERGWHFDDVPPIRAECHGSFCLAICTGPASFHSVVPRSVCFECRKKYITYITAKSTQPQMQNMIANMKTNMITTTTMIVMMLYRLQLLHIV